MPYPPGMEDWSNSRDIPGRMLKVRNDRRIIYSGCLDMVTDDDGRSIDIFLPENTSTSRGMMVDPSTYFCQKILPCPAGYEKLKIKTLQFVTTMKKKKKKIQPKL